MTSSILIVGTGPAALLAADLLSARGLNLRIFERRLAPGWKLLVAGSSGLNVSHEGENLSQHYTHRRAEIATCLEQYSREDWLSHLSALGEETFLGTSRRYFLTNKKASGLLSSWVKRLESRGVEFNYGEEFVNFSTKAGRPMASFRSGREEDADALLLALGGPSWETQPPLWPLAFQEKGISFVPFAPANAGWEFEVPEEFFLEAEGKPIKGLALTTARGKKVGECMITRYGLEGTPVYSVGCPGEALIDLKPDLEEKKLVARLQQGPAKLSGAKLSPGAELLLMALALASAWESPEALAAAIKALPINLLKPRPLEESISASGGLSWDELSENLELKKAQGVFCAGEMVDWDAPTGGFLLQASVSMGAVAARGILKKLALPY